MPYPTLRPLCLAVLTLAIAPTLPAGTTVWSVPVDFQEFSGADGGFETGAVTWQSKGSTGPSERSYDLVRAAGTDPATGETICESGQDGVADLTIRTRVIDNSGGRWRAVNAGKTPSGLQASTLVDAGTSRPGDNAVVVFELRFSSALQVTADQFHLKLVSANGTSELYEWTMVTLGGFEDAPFSASQIAAYSPLDYQLAGSGTYFDSFGQQTGNPGTGTRLSSNTSISQFLAGDPAAPVSGGLVRPGWYALDDFNAVVFDGPEDFLDNPLPGDGAIDDNQDLSGLSLGLAAGEQMTAITVWFGYHDVAFDTDGDGFTASDTNIYERVAGLTLGRSANPVPEPGISALGLVSLGFLLRRRRSLH